VALKMFLETKFILVHPLMTNPWMIALLSMLKSSNRIGIRKT